MYKLSPSDFAYLYEECKLCYYLKVKHGLRQPSMPMPAVFSAINTRLQTPLVGMELKALSDKLPEGKVVNQEGFVKSKPIPGTEVWIGGRYDLLVQSDDGSYTLVDLKISKPHEEKIDKYQTQLNAYAFALENPVAGEGIAISKMGLLMFYPDTVTFENGAARVDFPPEWLEVPVDREEFVKFAGEIDELLSGEPPAEGAECKWCQYRHSGEQWAHEEQEELF